MCAALCGWAIDLLWGGHVRPSPVGLLVFTLSALMISHCFFNPHPHARSHHHTAPAKKTHAALFNMKMSDAIVAAFEHFTFSECRQTELSVPVFAPHPSTETICLSNPRHSMHSTPPSPGMSDVHLYINHALYASHLHRQAQSRSVGILSSCIHYDGRTCWFPYLISALFSQPQLSWSCKEFGLCEEECVLSADYNKRKRLVSRSRLLPSTGHLVVQDI